MPHVIALIHLNEGDKSYNLKAVIVFLDFKKAFYSIKLILLTEKLSFKF